MKPIRYTRTALRALGKHRNMAARIIEKIEDYANDSAALSNMIKTLTTGDRRLRVGDFRVIFRETETAIDVLDIGPRSSIYD